MPRIKCPTCAAGLDVTDDMLGHPVQCGGCQAVFVAAVGRPSRRAPEPEPEPEEDERPSRRIRRQDDEDDYPEPRRRRRRTGNGGGMATASLVLGIIALVIEVPAFLSSLGGACCCCLAPLALIAWIPHLVGAVVGVVGLVLGILAQKQGAGGRATAGTITSGVAVIAACLGLILTILGVALPFAQPGPNNNQFNNRPVNPQPQPWKRR